MTNKDERKQCCCGEPSTAGTVHRTDGPCYQADEPALEVVAWQERASRNVNPQGVITSWSGWYDCRGPAKDYVKPENPRQETTYEWRPLCTLASAQAAVAAVKIRPAPCHRFCEANAFNIEIRQKDRRIAELEAALRQAHGALEIGLYAAREVAHRVHEELAGYKPAKHAGVDADVAEVEAAIATIDGVLK